MWTLLVSSLLISSAFAVPAKRIVGGSEAAEHSHPWQASLQYRGSHICGASVISSQWLITAAHCVDGFARSQLTVAVAEHDLDVDGTEVVHSLAKVTKHENYNANGVGFPNDIALIKVSEPIALTNKAAAIPIAPVGMDFSGANCYISGWGNTQGSQDRTVLQELRADVRTQQSCRNAWGNSYINDGHICVENGDTGACNGDSGGPLSCTVNGVTYLAGATSWGISGCTTRGYPSVYTRISHFNRWVGENMN